MLQKGDDTPLKNINFVLRERYIPIFLENVDYLD